MPNMSDVLITPTGTTSVRNSFLTDEQRAQLTIAASQGLSGRSCHKHERMALAEKIGVNEGTVKNWLNNQRRKRKSTSSNTTPQQQPRRKIKNNNHDISMYHSNSSSPLSGATSEGEGEDEDGMEPMSLNHCRVKSEPLDDDNNTITPSTSTSSNSSIMNPSPIPSPHMISRTSTTPSFHHMIDVLSHIDTLLSHVGTQWMKIPEMSLQLQTLFAFHQHILSYSLPTHIISKSTKETCIATSRPIRNIHPPQRYTDPLRMESMKRAVTAPTLMSTHVDTKPSLHINTNDTSLPTIRNDTPLIISPTQHDTHHPSSSTDDAIYGLTSLHHTSSPQHILPQHIIVTPFSHHMDTSSNIPFDPTSTSFSSHMDTSTIPSHMDTCTHMDAISRAVAPTLSRPPSLTRPTSLLTRPLSLPRQTSLDFLKMSSSHNHSIGLHGEETLFG